ELAADLRRSFRLRVERLVVRRTAVLPDQDTAFRPRQAGRDGGFGGGRAEAERVGESAADEGAEAELQTVAAGQAGAVGPGRHASSSILKHELRRIHQRPQEVFGRPPPRRARFGEQRFADPPFIFAGQPAVYVQVYLLDDL